MKLRTRKQIRENEEKIYLLRNRKIHVDKKKMSGKNVPVAALKIRSQNELLSSKGKERLHKKTPLKETNEKVKPPKFSKKLNLSQNKNFERKSKKLRERSFERDILGTSIAIPLCDVIDKKDQLCASEIAEIIIRNSFEQEKVSLPDKNYMRSVQTDLAPEMRTVLIDWLLEVQQNFKLKLETAFLAINFLDRFLSSFTLSRRNLQLTGCAALFLASKIEEVSPPLLRNFVFVCGGAGDTDDMLRMEELISKKLDWHFIVPTSLFFCERFLRVVGFKLAPKHCSEGNFSKENLDPDFVAEDLLKARNCALFLLELALLDYRFVGVEPSRVAAAATFFALKVYSSETDTVPLYMFSGWAEDDLVDCLSGFRGILEKGRAENSVFRKYEKLLDLKELMAIGLKF